MYIVISFSLMAILLTYLNSIDRNKNGMFIGFCMVTFLAMIHYDYGNDYMSYYTVYLEISQFDSISQVLKMEVYREPGWAVLNYIFRYFGGFFGLVAVISLFEGIVYYKAIKRYLPKKLWVFGVFMYLCMTSFYLINFSMLRQGLVVSILLSLWPWIMKKRWLPSLVILYLSSLIHASAIILLPFAFWAYVPVKNGRPMAIGIAVLVAIMSFSTTLQTSITGMLSENSETFSEYSIKYEGSENNASYGLGFLIYLIPTIVNWLYLGFSDTKPEDKSLAAMALVSTLITPFTTIIPAIGRLGIYFAPFGILSLPQAYSVIKNKSLRIGLISLYVMIILYDYYIFFTSEVFGKYYAKFHTIFEQL